MASKSNRFTAGLDDKLSETARLLTQAARRRRPLEPLLEQYAPDIVRQIRQDAESRRAFAFWTTSRNHDEHARATIVHPAILRSIGNLAGIHLGPDTGHAGLTHTYGYLLSTLKTKYGYKRERWVSPALDRAFGFREPTLRAVPKRGTLLANATCVFGRIAFRSRSRETGSLALMAGVASEQAVEFDYDQLQMTRITEHVKTASGKGVYFKTDLVTLPNRVRTTDGRMALLVYSTVEGRRAKLVTGFPITTKAAEELIEQSPKSRGVEVRPRYNACVEGVPETGMTGDREVEFP